MVTDKELIFFEVNNSGEASLLTGNSSPLCKQKVQLFFMFMMIKVSQTAAKDPALWRQACESNIQGQWLDTTDYLVLLILPGLRGLPAEGGALCGVLVLPPDRATRLISDTLNLSGDNPPERQWQVNKERGQSSLSYVRFDFGVVLLSIIYDQATKLDSCSK